jgi:hypothetical protein
VWLRRWKNWGQEKLIVRGVYSYEKNLNFLVSSPGFFSWQWKSSVVCYLADLNPTTLHLQLPTSSPVVPTYVLFLFPPFSLRLFLINCYWFHHLVSDTHIKLKIRTNVHRAIMADGSHCEMTLHCSRACFLPISRITDSTFGKKLIGSHVSHPYTSWLSSITSRTSFTVSGYTVTFIKPQAEGKRNAGHFYFPPYFPSSTLGLNSCWQICAELLLFHSHYLRHHARCQWRDRKRNES